MRQSCNSSGNSAKAKIGIYSSIVVFCLLIYTAFCWADDAQSQTKEKEHRYSFLPRCLTGNAPFNQSRYVAVLSSILIFLQKATYTQKIKALFLNLFFSSLTQSFPHKSWKSDCAASLVDVKTQSEALRQRVVHKSQSGVRHECFIVEF